MIFLMIAVDNNKIIIINMNTSIFKLLTFQKNVFLKDNFFFNIKCCEQYSLHNQEIRFCLVFKSKIYFYRIIHNHQITDIIEIESIEEENIISTAYNKQFMILFIEKEDYVFEFYNLAQERFINNTYEFKLDVEKSLKIERKSDFFNFFRSESKENEFENFGFKSKFFLETIDKRLYFICLIYEEENNIQIFIKDNLNSLRLVKKFTFDKKYSTAIQIIDNTLILHYLSKKESAIIGLRENDGIGLGFPMTNKEFFDQKMRQKIISIDISGSKDENKILDIKFKFNPIISLNPHSEENLFLYNGNLLILDDIIYDKTTNEFFLVKIDSSILLENSRNKSKTLTKLLKLKKSKEIFLRALYDYIEQGSSFKEICSIFEKISKYFKKTNNLIRDYITENRSFKNNLCPTLSKLISENDIINPKFIFHSQLTKLLLKQNEIYNFVFINLAFSKKIDTKTVFKLLIQFRKYLVIFNVPLHLDFFSCALHLLKKIDNLDFIYFSLLHQTIPDNVDIATYLINISLQNSKIVNQNLFILGIDSLVRLKKVKEIFQIFLKNGCEHEAFNFIKNYNKLIEEFFKENDFRILKELTLKNSNFQNLVQELTNYDVLL